jgi:hypothetical protein
MNLKELKEQVDWLYEHQLLRHQHAPEDITVSIVVKTVGTVGGTPGVGVKSMQSGFDWDNGKLMIYPEKDLRSIEADELERLRKASDKEGWAQYENMNLKRELKKLKEELANLRDLTKNK